jgi:hypothetical protein
LQRPGTLKPESLPSNSLKIVAPVRRRDSAA